MIAPERVAAILLAAGRASRFKADKLLHPLRGQALGLHAARALIALPFARRIAVTKPGGIRYDAPDFRTVLNEHPEAGLSASIRLGLAAVADQEIDAVLIALADMPFVPVAHLCTLLAHYRDATSLIASRADHTGPPVLFGRAWFPRLAALSGDRGADSWLAEADTIACDPAWLADIDTRADLPPGP